ncbi:MAG: hypothetical protein WAN43_03245 [Rhodomicrobium sp.]
MARSNHGQRRFFSVLLTISMRRAARAFTPAAGPSALYKELLPVISRIERRKAPFMPVRPSMERSASAGVSQKVGGDPVAGLIIRFLAQFVFLDQAKLVFQVVMRILLADQNMDSAGLLLELCAA